MTPTEQQNAALAAFVACVVARLNPTLRAHTQPYSGEGEYEVLIGGRGVAGVVHEDIEAVLRIAKEHGGRAFIDTRDIHRSDAEWKQGRLCIVWPGRSPSGPDPESEHEEQVRQGRRKARSTP